MIDELPLLALAGAMARGDTIVRGAAELRVKETDRIETVTTSLKALGVRIEASDDGFRVRGSHPAPRVGVWVVRRSSARDARRGRRPRLARGRAHRGRGSGRGKLPQILRPSRVGYAEMIVTIDGPAGARKSTVASLLAERSLPLPRHRGDVPRLTWLAMQEALPLGDGDKIGALAREPGRARRVGPRRDRRHRRHRSDPPIADRPHGARRCTPPRGARGHARAPA